MVAKSYLASKFKPVYKFNCTLALELKDAEGANFVNGIIIDLLGTHSHVGTTPIISNLSKMIIIITFLMSIAVSTFYKMILHLLPKIKIITKHEDL
jgi:hypothetical protein